jgi:Transposase IS116/IS110/IS902 family
MYHGSRLNSRAVSGPVLPNAARLQDVHGGQLKRPPLGAQIGRHGVCTPASSPPTGLRPAACKASLAKAMPTTQLPSATLQGGLVFAQQPIVLRQALADVIEDACNELGGLARMAIERVWMQWQELDTPLAWCDARIAAHLKASEPVRRGEQLLGIGLVTASAVVATVGDFKQFKNGTQFGAWPGWVPRQRK